MHFIENKREVAPAVMFAICDRDRDSIYHSHTGAKYVNYLSQQQQRDSLGFLPTGAESDSINIF